MISHHNCPRLHHITTVPGWDMNLFLDILQAGSSLLCSSVIAASVLQWVVTNAGYCVPPQRRPVTSSSSFQEPRIIAAKVMGLGIINAMGCYDCVVASLMQWMMARASCCVCLQRRSVSSSSSIGAVMSCGLLPMLAISL